MDRVDYQSLIIQDLINLNERGELNTNPWYQRRSVWTNTQKSYLINTLFERKPIPSLYVRHSLDLEKGISLKEVVDGQQRTRAILSYYNNEYSARHPEYKKRVKFNELTKQQKSSFLLTALPVGYLLGSTDEDVIDIFARINSVSKTLNTQEKRNAQFSGEFKQFVIKQTVIRTEFWKEYKIFSANDIARMGEVQFMSDVIINLLEGVVDFSQSKIDKYYKDYDDDFPKHENIQKRLEKVFDKLSTISPNTIKQTIFNRQPLFFSLLIALDKKVTINDRKLEKALIEIDERFNTDKPLASRPKDDQKFHNACLASTQRVANRKIRDSYITKFF